MKCEIRVVIYAFFEIFGSEKYRKEVLANFTVPTRAHPDLQTLEISLPNLGAKDDVSVSLFPFSASKVQRMLGFVNPHSNLDLIMVIKAYVMSPISREVGSILWPFRYANLL